MADELAAIIVGFPAFVLVSWWIVRDVRREPERLESSVRKWLTYIALVITASALIADLVTFLAYFFRGDLDTRFVLKTVTVLVIAGGIFAYFFDSLRLGEISPVRNRVFTAAALALVVFGTIVGFAQIGPPSVRRSLSEDERRLYDLSSLAQALHAKWETGRKEDFELPRTIQDLKKIGIVGGVGIADPVTGRAYDYAPAEGAYYRLCATFSLPSPADVPPQWLHPSGPTCFALDARENVAIVVLR